MNCRQGPFNNNGHHTTLKCFGQRLLDKVNHKEEVLQLLYEDIAYSMNMEHDAGFGDEEHQKRVFAQAKSEFLSAGTGAVVVRDRWWRWEDQAAAFQRLSWITCYVLLFRR